MDNTQDNRSEDSLGQDAFDLFLKWLDPDREQAGFRYEEIRRRLVMIFASRGCAEAEDLADQTIRRVIRKSSEISDNFAGDKAATYFYAVARNIHREYLRKKDLAAPSRVERDDALDDTHERLECLERCLQSLSAENRELILHYYQDKIGSRKDLADKLGIPLNSLRIRTFRIRSALGKCVQECMKSVDG